MLSPPSEHRARRYVAWLERRKAMLLGAAVLAVAGALVLIATRLPIRADFSELLPRDAPAVRDLRALEARMPAHDTAMIVIVAPDATVRAAAGRQLLRELRAVPAELVSRIEGDDDAIRRVIAARWWLYIPLADLVAARDALAPPSGAGPQPTDLAALLDRVHAAERELARTPFVSTDGLMQLVVVRTTFRATDVPRDRELVRALHEAFDRVAATVPGVRFGLAGGPSAAIAEHDAVAHGMTVSALATALLVALVLMAHLRGLRPVALVGGQLVAATILAFGLAAITVGHLNAATAFLGAIIAGNGVNYGILLVARFTEETALAPQDRAGALARAIAATLRPTLVASLGAAIAYGALAATRFRGFSDFAIIGGVGMLVCWVVAYSVLPILLLRATGRAPARVHASPFAAVAGRFTTLARPRVVLATACFVALGAAVIAARFVASDPFEYDLTHMRSDSPAAVEVREWVDLANVAFGRGVLGRSYVAVDRDEDVPALVTALATVRATPAGATTIGKLDSVLELVPAQQGEKLVVLAEIRRRFDERMHRTADGGLDLRRRLATALLPPELRALRPPNDLRAVTLADFPDAALAPFRERDGSIGRIVAVRPAPAMVETDGHAMARFAAAVRAVEVPGAHLTRSGSSLVFTDILEINREDGPRVTAVAALALVVMVLLMLGRTRRSAAVLAATGLGSLAMVAICALAGLHINFLDFVALPIALGLGIDYAVNIAERTGEHGTPTDSAALRATAATVLVCSLTTLIGYASLLVSANRAIREFGLASLVGELTCVAAALVLVPAWLAERAR